MNCSSIRPFAAPVSVRAVDRRLSGAAVTLLIHCALILVWQMARPLAPAQPEEARSAIQWIRLPALLPQTGAAPTAAREDTRRRTRSAAGRSARTSITTAPDPVAAAVPEAPGPAAAAAPAGEAPGQPAGAETIMERARRSAGSADRALRKESRPYIVAPLDSPQIRMRDGIKLAQALAPGRLWQAPKIDELVNNTGDGARRTRIITGNGTYCVTERSPATSIDMIEKHGKLRFTSCPQHEEPAKQQEWRTARD